MERISVISTTVASVGYEPDNLTLEIEFTNGSVYQYFDVPQSIHAELMGSDSKGKTVNTLIRPNYRFAKQ